MRTLSGIIVAMATPFQDDQHIDLSAVAPLCDRLIDAGACGLFAAGTMGEAAHLTCEEKNALVRATVKAANGRVPVVAGSGGMTTREVLALNERLADSGADVLSVVTPYYYLLSQDELYGYYAEILDHTKLPVMAYNIPKFTGCNIEPATIRRLAVEHGLVGVKDSSGNFANMKGYIDQTGPEFTVIVGADELICDGLAAGAKGAISAPSNVFTRVIRTIYDRCAAGDPEGARAAQQDWNHIIRLMGPVATFPENFKAFANACVTPIGHARRPVLPADPARVASLLPALREIEAKYL